jgi:putative protease
LALFEERNKFSKGDKVELFRPFKESLYFTIEKMYDNEYNELDVARHPQQLVWINVPEPVEPYHILRKVME